MLIRSYRPGDEAAQGRIYKSAAGSLPCFKPADVEGGGGRYRAGGPRPAAELLAAEGGAVGYAVFNPNGRISSPWCLPAAEHLREPLLDAVLAAMLARGHEEAWAAYRADWEPVLSFFLD